MQTSTIVVLSVAILVIWILINFLSMIFSWRISRNIKKIKLFMENMVENESEEEQELKKQEMIERERVLQEEQQKMIEIENLEKKLQVLKGKNNLKFK